MAQQNKGRGGRGGRGGQGAAAATEQPAPVQIPAKKKKALEGKLGRIADVMATHKKGKPRPENLTNFCSDQETAELVIKLAELLKDL